MSGYEGMMAEYAEAKKRAAQSEVIPAQAVEAAAKFLLDDNPFNDQDELWQVPSIRDHYKAVALGALEAAAPHMLAVALEEAADRVMGPSDVLLDGATCRWIAMEMRERAAAIRKAP